MAVQWGSRFWFQEIRTAFAPVSFPQWQYFLLLLLLLLLIDFATGTTDNDILVTFALYNLYCSFNDSYYTSVKIKYVCCIHLVAILKVMSTLISTRNRGSAFAPLKIGEKFFLISEIMRGVYNSSLKVLRSYGLVILKFIILFLMTCSDLSRHLSRQRKM